MKTEGMLEDFQNAVENKLLQMSELRNVPILNYKQSCLRSVIESNVKSCCGISITIMPPVPIDIDQNVAGPVFNKISLEVDVTENIGINSAGQSLLFVVETVMRRLHMQKLRIHGDDYQIKISKDGDCCRLDRSDDFVRLRIKFTTSCGLKCA